MIIETIETERLYLRGFEKEDADFAISIWNDPEMGEYLGDPTLDHVDEAYRKSIEALGENKTCCYLISESKAGKERIGTCSFIPRQDGKVYDIAYCVHKKYWRNGYATEMVKGMVDYARGQGAEKITVSIDQANAASNAVVRKLGFTVASEDTYRKRGTDRVSAEYRYELIL